MTSDLIDSRISEIRERLAKATKGPWIQTWDIARGVKIWPSEHGSHPIFQVLGGVSYSHVIDADPVPQWKKNADFVMHAPSDLEALLAEREGMKAEIERLREDVSEKHPQISDTLHRQMPCGEVDAANRANGTASVGLPHSAEVAASHSCPICGRIAPEHDVGCPVDLYVRRLSAPLDPSSAPANDLAELFNMIARRDPSVTAELFDTREFGERAARIYAALGESAEQRVARIFDEARRQMKPKIDAELQGENITSEIMDFRMRSPDREAGSATDDAETGGKVIDLMVALKESLGLDASHPVPSEGGGEP